MTKKVLLISILFEILVISSCAFYFYKNQPKKLSIQIEGRFFKDEDGKPIQLKGISTTAFINNNYNLNKLVAIIDFFRKKKVNALILYISPDKIDQEQKDIDYLVYWTKKNNMILYLIPTMEYNSSSKNMGDFMNLSLYLIKRYQIERHILFGLWAEPQGISEKEWKHDFQLFINEAKKIKKDVIIGVSGLGWARFIPRDINFQYQNIFLSFSDYPASIPQDLIDRKNITESNWPFFIDRYPVVLHEFGGVSQNGFGTEEDLDYFKKVINIANNKLLNYFAYTIDEAPGQSLIVWWTKKLTGKGEIFIRSLDK